MGTLFSSLDIARAGLSVAQIQLDITGHNIANVNREGFSRQRVELTTRIPNFTPYGAVGRGPAVDEINRLRDTFLDQVFREQVPNLGMATTRAQYYGRIEDIFLEPTENGFSNRLNIFFDALNDFANNTEELPVREALIAEAESMATSLAQVDRQLHTIRTGANEEVRNLIPEINSLAERIAESNRVIFNAELSGRAANDLRDERDVLLDDLAELVNITYRERSGGFVDVQIGGEEFITGTTVRALITEVEPTIDPSRPDLLAVRFSDDNQDVDITTGELAGTIDIRDVELREIEERLDELARALIGALNSIHSQGNGLNNLSVPLATSNAVGDTAAALDTQGLVFDIVNGAFDIAVYDAAGTVIETINVAVDPAATSLQDIADAINGSANMTAAITSGLLTVTPAAGTTYVFANDTSGVLAAVGMNSFFTGIDAGTIAVSEHIAADPRLISSSYSLDALETGDNQAALDLAAIRNADILSNNSQTANEYYEATIVTIGINAQSNAQLLEVERAFVEDFESRRQEVAGVNLDEEVTNLIVVQRAFEASARVISVTDRMLETLVNLV